MTQKVRDWLPIDVVSRDEVQAILRQAVADWSARWFSKRRISLASYAPAAGGHEGKTAEGGWRVYRKEVAVHCPAAATSRLAGWALDARPDDAVATEGDRRLVEQFGRKLLQDLAATIELALELVGEFCDQPLRIEEPYDRMGGVILSLAEGQGVELLKVGVPLHAVAPLCRATFKPTTRGPAVLEILSKALWPTPVIVEATLGQANISLADLQTLEPGDVLILSTALDQPAEIALSGSARVLARGKLSDTDGQIALTLQACQ